MLQEVICRINYSEQLALVQIQEIYLLEKDSIMINSKGETYGTIYNIKMQEIGRFNLSIFKTLVRQGRVGY